VDLNPDKSPETLEEDNGTGAGDSFKHLMVLYVCHHRDIGDRG
jgi:hypothetical protein